MTYYVIKASNSINNTTDNLVLSALQVGAGDNLLVLYDGYVLATGANSDGVYVNGYATGSVVTVNGLVSGTRNGLYSLGQNAQITVNGQVLGEEFGISVANGGTLYVSSSGLVSGNSTGVALGGSTLINNGTVNSTDDEAIQLSSGNITNSGLISAAYTAIGYTSGGSAQVNNLGTIIGDFSSGASDPTDVLTIENSGLWSGGIYLADGSDTLTNSGKITGGVSLGGGNDSLNSRNGFIGGLIYAGDGADTIQAGAEDNSIEGGAGADTLDGGGGVNTVSYNSSAGKVRIDLLNGIVRGGDAGGDTLHNFQNVTGSLYDDKLTGDNGDNLLDGVLGNDVLTGNGGNDTLSLLAGTLAGGDSLAKLDGGAGNDVFQLRSLDPATYGSAFSAGSRIIGGSGYDTLVLGNTGSVTFSSSTVRQVERILVEDGFNYTLKTHDATVGAGLSMEVDASALTGGNRLKLDGSAETNGSFELYGGGGKDVLVGGAGADFIQGGLGSDTVKGGAGDDIFAFNSYLELRPSPTGTPSPTSPRRATRSSWMRW